jgi:Spy/CpxP family protein refolding chaperone
MTHFELPNSNRRRFALAAIGAAGALGIARLAEARPWRGGRGGMAGLLKLMDDLDLTEAQELAAVRLRRSLREEGKKMREASREDLAAAAAELKAEAPDRDRLRALADRAAARMKDRSHAAIDAVLEFQGQLRPEQREKLAAAIESRLGRMDKRKQR